MMNAHDTPHERARRTSVWNIPNALTVLRIILVPVYAFLALRGTWNEFLAALIVFCVAAYTDRLDGTIARKRGIVTNFGKIADPFADKALMITAFIILTIPGQLPWWFTGAVIARELAVTALRFILLRAGKVLPASSGGKLKTVLQMFLVVIAMVRLLMARYSPAVETFLAFMVVLVMVAAFAVTLITGFVYFYDAVAENKRAARESRVLSDRQRTVEDRQAQRGRTDIPRASQPMPVRRAQPRPVSAAQPRPRPGAVTHPHTRPAPAQTRMAPHEQSRPMGDQRTAVPDYLRDRTYQGPFERDDISPEPRRLPQSTRRPVQPVESRPVQPVEPRPIPLAERHPGDEGDEAQRHDRGEQSHTQQMPVSRIPSLKADSDSAPAPASVSDQPQRSRQVPPARQPQRPVASEPDREFQRPVAPPATGHPVDSEPVRSRGLREPLSEAAALAAGKALDPRLGATENLPVSREVPRVPEPTTTDPQVRRVPAELDPTGEWERTKQTDYFWSPGERSQVTKTSTPSPDTDLSDRLSALHALALRTDAEQPTRAEDAPRTSEESIEERIAAMAHAAKEARKEVAEPVAPSFSGGTEERARQLEAFLASQAERWENLSGILETEPSSGAAIAKPVSTGHSRPAPAVDRPAVTASRPEPAEESLSIPPATIGPGIPDIPAPVTGPGIPTPATARRDATDHAQPPAGVGAPDLYIPPPPAWND